MGTRQSIRRIGGPSDAEKNLVAAVVIDNPGEITGKQVAGLAKALRRSPAAIKSMIEDAREKFQGNAGRYVDIHMQATEAALRRGSDRSLETATKAAQWAVERSSGQGVRVIDPKVAAGEAGPAGPRIMIGIKIGSVDQPQTEIPIDATVTEVEPDAPAE